MTLNRDAIAIQPCQVSAFGSDLGYTDTPFEWYPEIGWDPIFTEQLGIEPADFDYLGIAAYGTVRLMQYDAATMAAAFGPWNSSKTTTYPNASVLAGMAATEITGATGALVVTPTKTAARRQKLTVYNGLITVARGAQLRWGQRLNVGIPLMVFALRDGSGNGWKIEPSA